MHPVLDIQAGKFNTFSGKVVDIMNPTVDMIDSRDIAMGLSNNCRWGGQCNHFYSLAQHSIYVATMAPAGLEPEALIHDASEAYLGDVIKPLKVILGKVYADIEEKWMRVICSKYGVDYNRLELIKEYDIAALVHEFDYFFKGERQCAEFHNILSNKRTVYEGFLNVWNATFPS